MGNRQGVCGAVLAFAVWPALASADTCLSRPLHVREVTRGDVFGSSVYVDSQCLLVGAASDDSADFNAGVVYVFAASQGGYSLQEELCASDASECDFFGCSIDRSGRWMIVGASGVDGEAPAQNVGSAYVFVQDSGGAWSEHSKIDNPEPGHLDQFGDSVAIGADVAVIGCHGDDDNSGSAYVFRFDGGEWVQEARLAASDAASQDAFGISVDTDGVTAVVGASGDENRNGACAGAAYVFCRGAGEWREAAKLLAADGSTGSLFGSSVALENRRLVVGASQALIGSGKAYVFEKRGMSWVEEATLVPGSADAGDRIGASVAISGDIVVVGAPRDDEFGKDAGSAFLFAYDGTEWALWRQLGAVGALADDRFGWSVAAHEEEVLVGAYFAGTFCGAVYSFPLAACGAIPGDVTGDGSVDVDDLIAVLLDWVDSSTCPSASDLNGDGAVGVDDLIAVIVNWD